MGFRVCITLHRLIISVFFLPIASAFNPSYPAVFNFGDSNSDTGGYVASAVAFQLGPLFGETYFHKASGRFCDGRVIIDFLMDAMGLPFLNPYLDSVGAPNFRKGCNFATGGASVLPPNVTKYPSFSFRVQVSQFVRFKARAINLLAEGKKVGKYLPPKHYFTRGLYMLDVGQNDLDSAFDSKSEDQVIAFIPTILSELENGIQRLYNEGARNFWIHNTGPLGCIPRIIATFGKNASNLDQLGCISSHNLASRIFNTQLHDLCTKIKARFPDAIVTYVDIFSIKWNLISKFSQYGFKEPLAACCGYGGPPLNFDTRIACGATVNLNGTNVTANACSNTSEYVNWDGNHYTEAANWHVAEEILAGNYTDPPLSTTGHIYK
ncbi:hypothetical protein Tsubulata_025751 [Turnera subulata]|uniref:Alpha-L-fucosidase n=1 Tax=Turnera subulata TaxID=218843 RepID=A0A9Q0FGR1_9ROSI|nr:hypothetical protein Tsubulata_025751 [Turnera subulata]